MMNLPRSKTFAYPTAALVFGLIGVATSLSACSSNSDTKSDGAQAGEAGTSGKGDPGGSTQGGGIHLGSGGGTGVAGDGCGETALAATERPVNVLVLLDRSLSMNLTLSTTETTTRWEALRSALGTAMTNVGGRVAFGLKLFPDADATDDCGILGTAPEVTVGVGAESVAAIDRAIAQAVPNGGTPIAAALDWAKAYFTTGDGRDALGDRIVLLATDGAPNCNSQATCEAASCVTNIDHPEASTNLCSGFPTECLDGANAQVKVEDLLALANPVRTVVLGIPGSDKPAYAKILDDLGQVGGLPNPDAGLDYFAVSAEQGAVGLSDTLVRITTQLIVSCKLELTSTPPDPAKLNVYVDGAIVPRDSTNGWKLDSTTIPPTVLLQGTTCEKLEANGAQSISVKYGCPTYVLL